MRRFDASARLFPRVSLSPLPCDCREARYHWHLEITPRLTETAGFERGTGFYINPVMPEDAAQILREGAKAEPPH